MNKRLTIAIVVIIIMVCSLGVTLRIGLSRYKEYVVSNTGDVGGNEKYQVQGISDYTPADDTSADDTSVDDTSVDNTPTGDNRLNDTNKDSNAYDVQEKAETEKNIVTAMDAYQPRTYRGDRGLSRGGVYSAMGVTASEGSNGEAVYTDNIIERGDGSKTGTGIVVKIMQGDSSKYLTNKSVLLDIHYPEDAEKTISIGGESTRTLSTEEGEFNYVVRVRDNVVINAGGAEFDVIKNIVKVETGCEVNATAQTGYVKNKTYYSARLGGKITNSEGVAFTTTNVKELGVRYWRSDIDETYTVKYNKNDMLTVSNNDNFKVVKNEGGVLQFEILARSLKENTTYYMQAYMINADNEVLLGDVKEFATRGQGQGLYGLYYSTKDSSNPTVIKQEIVDTMKFTELNRKKVKWVGEIVPVNNGVMKFKTTTDADKVSIKISNGTADIYVGETADVDTLGKGENTTDNIYKAGEKYKIIIEVYKSNGSAFNDFKLEWMEDGQWQEVPKTQLYPKEYIKISSAVINSIGTDNQTVGSDGKLINKKVITYGQNMSSCIITYTNDVASDVTIGSKKYKIIHEKDAGHSVGANLSNDRDLCTIEGWIIYNTNNVVEPIVENVESINYSNKKVTLRNGSEWTLFGDKGVDIVGRVVVRKKDDKEVYEVYDLGRYISDNSSSKLSDGKSYSSSEVYRTVEEDNTYVVNLVQGLGESDTYQKVLNQYSTMEHFVEDSKSVDKKWNLGIGEGRIFSLVPIRLLVSFDGDEQFTMSNPEIWIDKRLYRVKNGATAKENENTVATEDGVFYLGFPTDVKKSVTSKKYADWRYMDANGKESTSKHQAKMEDEGDYIKITLEELDVNKEAKDDAGKTNIMLNFVVRLDSKDGNNDKTSAEIFKDLYLINNSYKVFTEVKIDSVKTSENDTATVKVMRLPVEIKVKPQVTFE